MTTLKNPNPYILLRIAQADAYCMATEYVGLKKFSDGRGDQTIIDALKFERYVKHPVHKLAAGSYTDDTQMSIAVAEQLLSGESSTKLSFANHFMAAFLRDKRDGYSRGFQMILEGSSSGQELLDKLVPNSTKNGAMMRAVPLGVIPDTVELLSVATTQAQVTHDSAHGIISACATALMSHIALYSDRSFEDACNELASMWPQFRDVFVSQWQGSVADRTKSGGYDVGINTVWAVATLLREQTTLMGMLKQIIEWGGDTDSVAAVTWGIASTRLKEQVPSFLETDLESNGAYGAQFLIGLGSRLMKKFETMP